MLIIFFDIRGVVHRIILAGRTVNSAYYCDVLYRLPENVRRLQPELWQQKNWLSHRRNTPSHTSFFTREFLTKKNMTVTSTHRTRLIWPFFPQLKIKLKVRYFDATEVIYTEYLFFGPSM
jgi:hypothetical protein